MTVDWTKSHASGVKAGNIMLDQIKQYQALGQRQMNESIVSIDKRNLIRKQISVLVEQYAEIVYANKAFTPGIDVIPPSGKLLDGEELKLMVEASLDGWLTAG